HLFLEHLQAAFDAGDLKFFGDLAPLSESAAFAEHLKPMHRIEWVVYAKRPFAGPQKVLDYLGRYTHRVAIANSRLLACENGQVRFCWKDYRAQNKKAEADKTRLRSIRLQIGSAQSSRPSPVTR